MESNRWPVWLAAIFALSQCLRLAQAEIAHLAIKDDSRDLISLESFGFTNMGFVEIQVEDVQWKPPSGMDLPLQNLGFFLATRDDLLQAGREIEDRAIECVLQSRSVRNLFTFIEFKGKKTRRYNATYPSPKADRYLLMFANCLQGVTVSMSVGMSTYNMDGNTKDYLSEGQTQLPALYFFFFWIYVVLVGVWIYVCVKQKSTAHRIHILMGVLVALKALYLLSEAEDKYYTKKTGTPHGWDIAFYAFSFLKGVMLFAVIVLIGTGWSFLKPYLQGREKKVLMVVIPLQVIANIARVVVEEAGLSDRYWVTWQRLFLFVDVICCCAVLFPIVWSMKHLREAARTDGKAARNLMKLKLFRHYYIVVVTYIYFTRIIVFALQTVTSYHYTWVSDLANEMATLAFYVFTGYSFRPVPHNPYFVLDDEEEEIALEALRDDEFEL